MPLSTIHDRSTLRPALLTSLLGAALFTACIASPPGLAGDEVAGAAGSTQPAQGGSDNLPAAGSSQTSDGGDAQTGADGGSADAQAGNATGGNTESGGGGALGEAGEPGQGNGGAGEVTIAATCPFHTDAVVTSGGAGGADRDASGQPVRGQLPGRRGRTIPILLWRRLARRLPHPSSVAVYH